MATRCLSRPGGNVTGFTTVNQELSGKRLEMLTQLAPSMRRFAVVLYPGSASEADSLRNYELLARSMQLEAVRVEIRSRAEIESAIAGIAQMRRSWSSAVLCSPRIAIEWSRLSTGFAFRLSTAMRRLPKQAG